MAYNARTLAQVAAFCTTPNGGLGGVWQADNGLAADSLGNIYFATGDGTFDANTGGTDYGDTVLNDGCRSECVGLLHSHGPGVPFDPERSGSGIGWAAGSADSGPVPMRMRSFNREKVDTPAIVWQHVCRSHLSAEPRRHGEIQSLWR